MANYFVSGYAPPKGVDSKEKVKQIQATLGVKQDGIWGAKTQAAWNGQGYGQLWKPEGGSSQAPEQSRMKHVVEGFVPPAGITDQKSVRSIQATLGVTQDGIWGANTQAAWEKQYGDLWGVSPPAPTQNSGYKAPTGIDGKEEIRQVQQRLGITADGIWGKATQEAWDKMRTPQSKRRSTAGTGVLGPNSFEKAGISDSKAQLAIDVGKGISPIMGFINPLQTQVTNVGRRPVPHKDGTVVQQLYDVLSNQRLLELDMHNLPNKKGTIIPDVPHMNVEVSKSASTLQKRVADSLNHKKVPTPVYEAFKNFDNVAKYTKTAGKALAVVGVALDAYELGSTIYLDLNDEDKKLGKKTLQTSVGIGASWAGGVGGAKLGAMGGAAVGTFFCPGLGTVIGGFIGGIGGGIAGALGGRTLSEYIIDKAYTGR